MRDSVSFFLLPCLGILLLLPSNNRHASAADDAKRRRPLVVFCVRHAEKVDNSRDPKLSAAGRKRAQTLATTLRSARLTHIYSSDFIRTRNTAAPTAQRHNLRVEAYDHGNLPRLAQLLLQTGGRHLVVGHSTTTPALVKLLGGKDATPIDEAGEYDRLYIVTIGTDGRAQTVLLRYGAPCKAAAKQPKR